MELDLRERAQLYENSSGKRIAQEMHYRAIHWKGDITLLGGPSVGVPFEHTRLLRGRYGKFISWENDQFNSSLQEQWYTELPEKDMRRVELYFGDIINAEPTSIIELDLEHGVLKEALLLKTLFVKQRDMIKGSKAFMFHVTGRGTDTVRNLLIPYINDLLGSDITIFSKNSIRVNGQYSQGMEYNLSGNSGKHSVKIVGYGDRGTMISVLILHGDEQTD